MYTTPRKSKDSAIAQTELTNNTSTKVHKSRYVRSRKLKSRNPSSDLLLTKELTKENQAPTAKTAPRTWEVPQQPYKVLGVPQLQDDFYLNVVDWSSTDVLSVGLGRTLFLWSVQTGSTLRLAELPTDLVSSVAWGLQGECVAAGSSTGKVTLYDVNKAKAIREMDGHIGRVGALSWNNWVLGSGSRDKSILLRDIRSPDHCSKLLGHSQEVCGLKWSDEFLASGGNDNKVMVWSPHSRAPLAELGEHKAAVKALAWSPHERGLLATGGGSADKTLRFWNCLDCTLQRSVQSDSQVCSLVFSRTQNGFVSTHGYAQNQVVVWDYKSLAPQAVLLGHTARVLYLAMSPDSESVVTGAGDETLRFWKVFPRSAQIKRLAPSLNDVR